MFSLRSDASKVALVHLAARLTLGSFVLLDTQFITSHLRQFGAIEITRADYHSRLSVALSGSGDFSLSGRPLSSEVALQSSTQTS